MEKQAKIYDLKERASEFSLSLIRFLKTFENDYISQTLGRQLLRSGTSVGANLVEAQAAPSKKDFANFYNIALKSANETKYWLFLLKKSSVNHKLTIEQLEKEIGELANIIAKCLLTMRGK